jgi:hypothetical protein
VSVCLCVYVCVSVCLCVCESVCVSVLLTRPSPTSGWTAGERGFAGVDVAQVKSQSMAKTVLPLKESKVSKVLHESQ